EVVDALLLLARTQRAERQRLRLAAGEEGRAVGAGHHADVAGDTADLGLGAAVRAPLVDGDLGPHGLLVDAVDRDADRGASQRVERGVAVLVRLGPGREGQLHRAADLVHERVALAGLELL